MIVSMIWNSSENFAWHLSCATAIFVVDCCQFGPSWIFGLKMEPMACADLVDGTTVQSSLFTHLAASCANLFGCTTDKSCLFLSLHVSINDMKHFLAVCMTPQPCHSHLCCWFCQFGPSWMFGLKMELMACVHLVGGKMEQSCIFPDLIW